MNLEKVVEENLILMKEDSSQSMESVLRKESFGGNAGRTDDGRLCAAANFYFDSLNGEIKCFGNVQDVSKKIVQNYALGAYRVALDRESHDLDIVDIYYKPSVSQKLVDLSDAPISAEAREVLVDSAELYNKV